MKRTAILVALWALFVMNAFAQRPPTLTDDDIEPPKPKVEEKGKPTVSGIPTAKTDSAWAEVSSEEGGFAARWPGKPAEKSQKIDTDSGQLNQKMFALEQNNIGYGLSGDAYHVTAPHPEGSGAYRSMAMALKKSGLTTADIDYINAHGTSTPLGDELELGAVRRLFGDDIATVSMSSTKSAIGHLLGGAGAVESIFCILAIRDQIVPPTLNLDNPSEGTAGVDLVPHTAKKRRVKAVLNNSFGFGGTNASLVMKAID